MTIGTSRDIIQNLTNSLWQNSGLLRFYLLHYANRKPRYLSFLLEEDDGILYLHISRRRYNRDRWKLTVRIEDPKKVFCNGPFTVYENSCPHLHNADIRVRSS